MSEAFRNRPWDLSGLAILSYPFKAFKSFTSRGFCMPAMAAGSLPLLFCICIWGFAGCFGWVNFTLNTLQILNGDTNSRFRQQQHKQIALLPLCVDSCFTIPNTLQEHEVAVEFQWPRLSPSVNLNMKNSLINHVITSYTEIGVWNLQY